MFYDNFSFPTQFSILNSQFSTPTFTSFPIDIRSGHRGQVTKGQLMKPILIGSCDACFMANFSFPTQWNWLDDDRRRLRLLSGEAQVNIRLRSGQKRSIFQIDIFHIKCVYSMQLITRNPMVVLVLLYVVNNGKNRLNM